MALAQTVETSTTETVKIAPALRRKLLTELKTYAELKAQRDAIDLAMKGHRENVGEIREKIGAKSLALDGFHVSLVEPVRSKLDPKKLIAQGVTPAQIENATVFTRSRAYEKITVPGEKNGNGEE